MRGADVAAEPLPTLVQQGPTASGVQIGPNGAAPLRERSAPAPRALMSRPALGCGAAKRANATSGHQRYRGPGKASGDDIMAVLLLTADYQLWDPREAHTSSTLGNRRKIFEEPLGPLERAVIETILQKQTGPLNNLIHCCSEDQIELRRSSYCAGD